MVIPRNITREHVLKAINEINMKGVDERRESRVWFLVYNDRKYPPKYVISLANKYVNGEPLSFSDFTAHDAVAYLRRLGFKIIRVAPEKQEEHYMLGVTREGLNQNSTASLQIETETYEPSEFDREMYRVFEKFASLLKERFEAIVKGCSELSKMYQESEDTIRYMMFYSLTSVSRISPLDFYLEYPHEEVPEKKYAKLDTYIAPGEHRPALAFEMKFKTRLPSWRNLPKTQVAGSAFADILRLAIFKPKENVKRYFVYVVDNEIITYYNNPANKLAGFFNLGLNKGFKLTRKHLLTRPGTTVKVIREIMGDPNNWPEPTIICRYKENFRLRGNEIAIRIYEVRP